MSPQQKARVAELEKKLSCSQRLSKEEYTDILRETRDNYVIFLLIRSIEMRTEGLGAVSNALERVGYLLEAVEPKAAPSDLGPKVLGWEAVRASGAAPVEA